MSVEMIKNFLIINFIGDKDKLVLRVNKNFFIYNLDSKKNNKEQLVSEISRFLNSHNVVLNEEFSVIVNQGPGSFSGIRISLAIAKGLEISKKVKLYAYNSKNLKDFDQVNIEKMLKKNLIEKKLIKPVYLS